MKKLILIALLASAPLASATYDPSEMEHFPKYEILSGATMVSGQCTKLASEEAYKDESDFCVEFRNRALDKYQTNQAELHKFLIHLKNTPKIPVKEHMKQFRAE